MLHTKIWCLASELMLHTKMCNVHFSFTFSEFGPRSMINCIWQSLCLDLVNINMCAKFYQDIQTYGQFHIFLQNLNLGKASTNDKWHLTIPWARSCQYQCVCNISSQYSTQVKRLGHFHIFRIWSSAKPWQMTNVILQSLGIDHVNINVCIFFYQNIPKCLRVMGIFRNLSGEKNLCKLSGGGHSEFGAQQRLDKWQMAFDNPLG